MDPTFLITDNLRSFTVTKRIAIDIELKLNKSEYGHAWSYIGDTLYDYGAKQKEIPVLTVTSFQYDFLKDVLDSLNHL